MKHNISKEKTKVTKQSSQNFSVQDLLQIEEEKTIPLKGNPLFESKNKFNLIFLLHKLENFLSILSFYFMQPHYE